MSEKKPIACSHVRPSEVGCLKCGRRFVSPDKSRIRICANCKVKKAFRN